MEQTDLFAQPAFTAPFDHQSFIALLIEQEKLLHSDIALAKLLNDSEIDDAFYLILLLLRAQRQQHSCLELEQIDWQNPFALPVKLQGETLLTSPWSEDKQAAIKALATHAAVGDDKPMRLLNNNLYLARYFDYEASLAEAFQALNNSKVTLNLDTLTELLNHFFDDQDDIDWQKVACAMAALNRFCVITGGPGTGKTTTVTKLLAILQSLYRSAPLSIKLVAPTGKAAARLTESMIGAKKKLIEGGMIDGELFDFLPEQAQTIHRLLGVVPHTHHFRHNEQNPLHIDLLIVDEASMIDLPLLSKLVKALPSHARLVLLGDKDQLASVDTGNVLGDLCEHLKLGEQPHYSKNCVKVLNQICFNSVTKLHEKQSHFLLCNNIAFLQQSHRFNAQSGIGQLAQAVNNNDQGHLQQTIQHGFEDLELYDFSNDAYHALIDRAAGHYQNYLRLIKSKTILNAEDVQAVHHAFSQYQLLAAVKEGPYGVNALNQRIEQRLHQSGLIDLTQRQYAGLPIMITQNDYQLNLFNGDIGVLVNYQSNSSASASLKAVFVDEQGHVRDFYPNRLPRHEKVYAMTIHKSQGSEFAHTAMLLPPMQRAHSGINRQLVYTGITRAKQKFELVAQMSVLTLSMSRQLQRCSGLRQRLQTS